MKNGIFGLHTVAHGLGCKCHPRVSVEAESGIELRAQRLGIDKRQGDERGGDVARHIVEDEADLLRKIRWSVFGAERVDGVVGQGAGGSHIGLLVEK